MILIAGGGFYGTKALLSIDNKDEVLVVDINSKCPANRYVDCTLQSLDELMRKGKRCRKVLLIADVVEVLLRLLMLNIIPSIIIPTVPIHLAGKVVERYLITKACSVYPSKSIARVVDMVKDYGVEVRVDSLNGIVVMSYMPFNKLCKPDCIEPPVCPITGKTKIAPLKEILKYVLRHITNLSIVLESQFIVEGIGGYSGLELYSFLKDLDKCIDRYNLIAIATACSCHGVANIFEVIPRNKTYD
ncbi:MAG: hypothetical protein QXG46_01655 [Ignisphaera sp.]